jgi:hypothetical protein
MREKTEQRIKDYIAGQIADHERRFHNAIITSNEICEVCGCVIGVGCDVVGKSEIRKRRTAPPYQYLIMTFGWFEEEYIYTPHYCKVHAPKDEDSK